jgi:hypothetical protein
MTTKSVFALAAILALGGLWLPTNVSAAHGGGGGHGGGGHVGGGHIAAGHFVALHGPGARAVVGHGPGIHVAPPGHPGRAFVAGAHRRHFWHGRWWYYGVGPCWVWSDFYGEYVWACD